jgi:hypothetical protein
MYPSSRFNFRTNRAECWVQLTAKMNTTRWRGENSPPFPCTKPHYRIIQPVIEVCMH